MTPSSDDFEIDPDAGLLQDETTVTDITITPDGRIFTFGTSRAIVEILAGLCPEDDKVVKLLAQLKTVETDLVP